MTLDSLIQADCEKPLPEQLHNLVTHIRTQMEKPDNLLAVLLYGSGLWQKDVKDCVWDLYILVEHFEDMQNTVFLKTAGALLPPNVYFTDAPLSCKYAVMRLNQFEHAASYKAWKPQIWARFAQPCRLIYARDEQTKAKTIKALSECVLTFHKRTIPFIDGKLTAKNIWTAGLKDTYASELRSEKNARIDQIFEAQPEQFEQRTKAALNILPGINRANASLKISKAFKRPLIKILYFLQLMKAVFTFQNSVDYALYKIKRHSGIELKATEFQRRHPLIGGWPLLWKIYKAGGLR